MGSRYANVDVNYDVHGVINRADVGSSPIKLSILVLLS